MTETYSPTRKFSLGIILGGVTGWMFAVGGVLPLLGVAAILLAMFCSLKSIHRSTYWGFMTSLLPILLVVVVNSLN